MRPAIKITPTITHKFMGTRTGFPWIVLLYVIFSWLTIYPRASVFGDNIQSVLQKSGYSQSQREAINRVIVEAEKDGIPQELLLPRLEEGIAKKVAGEKMLEALRDDIRRLREAREILMEVEGGWTLIEDRSSWARTANLLAGGASPQEVKQIAASSRNRWKDYRSATYLFFSLIQWGLAREISLKLTMAVLQSSITGEEFPGILDLLVEGRRLRIQPETVAERIRNVLPEIKTLEELKEIVIYR